MKLTRVERFTDRARKACAEVECFPRLSSAVDFLRSLAHECSKEEFWVAPSAAGILAGMDRSDFSLPASLQDYARGRGAVVQADFGIALTGTLVHLDTSDDERAAWTLPPLCAVLLKARKIVDELEDILPRIQSHLDSGPGHVRQVSLVTGPSRTADIEGLLETGVHGPCRLVICLIGYR